MRTTSLLLSGLLFVAGAPCAAAGSAGASASGGSSVPGASSVRQIGVADRIAVERAIAKVYYDHQMGATRSFDQALPSEAVERSVRRYLGQSAALRDYWRSPIESQDLRNEMTRIARATRIPERLGELYAAVGGDAFTFQETIARRTLADRWARALFAFDPRIHDEARREATALRFRLSEDKSLLDSEDPRRVVELSRVGLSKIATDYKSVDTTAVARISSSATSTDDGGAGATPARVGSDSARARATAPASLDAWTVSTDSAHARAMAPEDFARFRALAPASVGEIGPVVEEQDRFVVRVVLEETPERVRIATYSVPKTTWDEWWSVVGPDFESRSVPAVAQDSDDLPMPAANRAFDASDTANLAVGDSWDVGPNGDVPEGRSGASAVWTGSEMIVWGGDRSITRLATGGRYDPVTDSWRPVSLVNAPSPRVQHTAVWTGTRMVVWGGFVGSTEAIGTGALYDPVSDTWTPTATTGAPVGRVDHTAIWTGSAMIVWGGRTNDPNGSQVFLNEGGRYDPATNTWQAVSTDGAPEGRDLHTAVWTGSRMIVWGGHNYTYETGHHYLETGGRYDPASDAWLPTSLESAPEERYEHTAVWADHAMVVWGGASHTVYTTRYPPAGGRYDPETDTWLPTSTFAAPSGRFGHSAVWTGSEMLVWGGLGGGGSRYDPVADAWSPITSIGAPLDRSGHAIVWTGSSMIVWGGASAGAQIQSTGGRYDPALDRWTPTLSSGAPPAREAPTAVWTGSRMIVFGGRYIEEPVNTGGLYDPVTDSWTPTTTAGVPGWFDGHTAVWTGDRMIVWGRDCFYGQRRGGLYDPVSDSWQGMADIGDPLAGAGHTAVWTGSRMIVWGGLACPASSSDRSVTSAGASYDPASNTWQLLPSAKAPDARTGHTAVWTGSRMLVWGGNDLSARPSYFSSGAAFDPETNMWSPMARGRAPSRRAQHTAVWTGQEMIVWGGAGSSQVDTGGRYNPATDRWRPISTSLAPMARIDHTAIWSGSRMVIWGGEGLVAGERTVLDTGGRYDPVSDTWAPTTLIGAPSARTTHAAVWSGDFMLVWGGQGSYTLDTLGRYVVGP